ncbi:MAG: class A beta-lactamase-related serine hydrolase [Acidobacteriota bacterium]|nr:class A beta-lactamase-related serine hydrolase [Acidobacteriota bacterium]
MRRTTALFALALVALLSAYVPNGSAQRQTNKNADPAGHGQTRVAPAPSAELQSLVDEAAQEALTKFADKKLTRDQLAITLIDLRDPDHTTSGSFRGGERIYPASVVKLFYLVYAHRLMEDGKIADTPELRRALSDMIVFSYNDATGYVLDVVTDTSSGRELAPAEMKAWQYKRDAVNRYFASLGYANINTNQKTFCEDAYGREHFSRGPNGENRNKLTTDAVARLLAEIATGRAVTPERSKQMMELLKRDYAGESKDPDDQAHGFTGIALKDYAGARLWSKAGWTSTTRHDAAYVELPDGARFVLVTFTENQSNEREIIPTVARVVLNHYAKQ